MTVIYRFRVNTPKYYGAIFIFDSYSYLMADKCWSSIKYGTTYDDYVKDVWL